MPTWLAYTLGVLVFAVGLLLSIALHEIGHMVPAKKFGVKVTQYMVGFGPTLWSRKKGDTEYGIKAIPLGGYIRMIGMVPPRKDGTRSRWPRRLATAVEDFRQMSRAEVDPQDEHRQFYRLTPGKKMIVMLGGPCMNLVIFLVLFTILITAIGVEKSSTTTSVAVVEKCVVAANSPDADKTSCPANAPRTPALGKLRPGDRFVSIDGKPTKNWDDVTAAIQPAAGKHLNVVVDRGGKDVTLDIVPTSNLNYVGNSGTKVAKVGFLGFAPKEHVYFETVGITGVPASIWGQIRIGLDALGSYPHKIHSLWQTVFEGKKRDPNGAVGVVGIGRISGDFASSHLLDGKEKFVTLVGLLASVNLLLFFFNLLPLLPLDGGHVAGAIVEAAKRGRARLRARRRRPALAMASEGDGADEDAPKREPIFVDTASMLPVMYGVASVLILLTLLTLYADIVKPINPLSN